MIQTQLARARRGEATPEMEAVARAEGVDFQTLMERVAQGPLRRVRTRSWT
jgi:thiamine biosynthesis protein ThiC